MEKNIFMICVLFFSIQSASAVSYCKQMWPEDSAPRAVITARPKQQAPTARDPRASYFGRKNRPKAITSDKLNLLVWNVHKGTDNYLPSDFRKISATADIVLFQESVNEFNFIQDIANANPMLGWTQAKSFTQSDGTITGVATGSKYQPLNERVLLSPVTEPIIHTPKTILVSDFYLKDSQQKLMVVNIHAINFVSNSKFKQHIDQMVAAIYRHHGPLIIAGDFNTWNPGRMNYLNRSLVNFGLKTIRTPQRGVLILDHIFYRGVVPTKVVDLTDVRSSDHSPLYVEFSLNN